MLYSLLATILLSFMEVVRIVIALNGSRSFRGNSIIESSRAGKPVTKSRGEKLVTRNIMTRQHVDAKGILAI